jgi:hypothetical protein
MTEQTECRSLCGYFYKVMKESAEVQSNYRLIGLSGQYIRSV